MKYIDIHAHLNFSAYNGDREEVIKRTKEADISVINVGTQFDTSQEAVELARDNENFYATVGLHPIHSSKSHHDKAELGENGKEFVSRGEIFDKGKYRKLASDDKVVAIGECGMDYYRLESDSLEKQKAVFIDQIHLANELNKPLMLHIRNNKEKSAYRDSFEILKTESKVLGNLHFFAGDVAEAKLFLDLGYYFSFTAVITFTGDYDEVIRYIPDNKIMSETDCPYVAPASKRGHRNEPVNVIEVVQKLSDIRRVAEAKMNEQIIRNAKTFFNI